MMSSQLPLFDRVPLPETPPDNPHAGGQVVVFPKDHPGSPRMYTPWGRYSCQKFFTCVQDVLVDIDIPFYQIPGLPPADRARLLGEIKAAIGYLEYAYSQIHAAGLEDDLLAEFERDGQDE